MSEQLTDNIDEAQVLQAVTKTLNESTELKKALMRRVGLKPEDPKSEEQLKDILRKTIHAVAASEASPAAKANNIGGIALFLPGPIYDMAYKKYGAALGPIIKDDTLREALSELLADGKLMLMNTVRVDNHAPFAGPLYGSMLHYGHLNKFFAEEKLRLIGEQAFFDGRNYSGTDPVVFDLRSSRKSQKGKEDYTIDIKDKYLRTSLPDTVYGAPNADNTFYAPENGHTLFVGGGKQNDFHIASDCNSITAGDSKNVFHIDKNSHNTTIALFNPERDEIHGVEMAYRRKGNDLEYYVVTGHRSDGKPIVGKTPAIVLKNYTGDVNKVRIFHDSAGHADAAPTHQPDPLFDGSAAVAVVREPLRTSTPVVGHGFVVAGGSENPFCLPAPLHEKAPPTAEYSRAAARV